jgi:hypothetical protein
MGQYADTSQDDRVDAVALAAELAAAFRAVVAYDDAVASRHALPDALRADGLSQVIGHWVRQDALDPYTEWPSPWVRLYQALKALPPPPGLGAVAYLSADAVAPYLEPCPHGYGGRVCPTCDGPGA